MMILTEDNKNELAAAAYAMRLDILDLCRKCGTQKGHLGGCMSAVELLAVLYLKVMNITDPTVRIKKWDDRDRFIMSKGHAGIALYAALKQAGILSQKHFDAGIRGENTILYRHPKINKEYGIECSVGSLGMGIGFAAGLAEAAKRRKKSYNVYTMLGDGECDEGSVWETLAYASHRKLENFIVIIDRNGLQLDGKTENILDMNKIEDKLRAFGFVTAVADGHDFDSIYSAFRTEHGNRPLAVVADTIKGKGVSFAENKSEWHDNILTEELYGKALAELEESHRGYAIGYVFNPADGGGNICEEKTRKTVSDIILDEKQIAGLSKLSVNNAAGLAAEYIAEQDSDFAIVFSDCAARIGINEFWGRHPEMCYETGISEQNQLSVSAALALEGFNVFTAAYAPFITARVLDQIRVNLGYMKSPVKILGLSAGYAAADLGATHTALEDVGNIRGIPNMTVISPADRAETFKAMIAAANMNSPVYIRLTQGAESDRSIYGRDYKFEVGKGIILREGSDVAVIGCGAVLYQALQACEILENHGVRCKLINMHTIKPLDVALLDTLKNMKLIVTVEEHNVIGGLGSAVSEYLSSLDIHPPLLRMGAPDSFFSADLPVEELKKAGLTPAKISEKIMERLERISCSES